MKKANKNVKLALMKQTSVFLVVVVLGLSFALFFSQYKSHSNSFIVDVISISKQSEQDYTDSIAKLDIKKTDIEKKLNFELASNNYSSVAGSGIGFHISDFSLERVNALSSAYFEKDTFITLKSLAKIKSCPECLLVVNFFASWCQACFAEAQYFHKIKKNNFPIKVVGIAVKDDIVATKNFLNLVQDPYDVVLRTSYGFYEVINFGVIALPETIIMTQDGYVLWRHRGEILQRDFKAIVNLFN